jgi:hypothetical protein
MHWVMMHHEQQALLLIIRLWRVDAADVILYPTVWRLRRMYQALESVRTSLQQARSALASEQQALQTAHAAHNALNAR